MPDLWGDDVTSRAKASAALDPEAIRYVQEAFSATAFQRPWPFGMPTSVNPALVLLGPSPGGSPRRGDTTQATVELPAFELPTLGTPHPRLNYEDGRGFFVKVRACIETALFELYGIQKNEALALGGLMNMDTAPQGDASKVQLREEVADWVVQTICQRMRPRFLICLGLNGRTDEVLRRVDPTMVGQPPDAIVDFEARTQYKFRIWVRREQGRKPMLITFWPQHPSRPPFNNPSLWEQSVRQFCHIARTEFPDAL